MLSTSISILYLKAEVWNLLLLQGHDLQQPKAILGSHVNRPKQYNLQSMSIKNQVNFCTIKRFTLTYIEGPKLVQRSFSMVIDTVLFLFSLFFLCLCSLCFLFCSNPLLHVLLSVYIPPFEFHPHHTCVGWVRRISFCPIWHLLELPIGSCQAASLLFRYHLHINAARELVERSLMRRQP